MSDDSAKIVDLLKAFDPNEVDGDQVTSTAKSLLPSYGAVGIADRNSVIRFQGVEGYIAAASSLTSGVEGQSILEKVIEFQSQALQKDFTEFAKAIDIPGNLMSFARMSYMPDATASGILQWPGVHPEALRKIIRENIAPNLIIGMRVDDILKYSQPSPHPWKPGWRVEVFQGQKHPTEQDKKQIKEAEQFLWNSSMKFSYPDALARDEENLTDFQRFLAAGTRDTLSFDGLAISTERDAKGRVSQYGLLPAGNIRLVGPQGYESNSEAFAVAVDEGGAVKKHYKRSELIWYIRNIRVDPEYSISLTRGYGYPEIDQSLKLIQGFTNVIEYNTDIFNRSGVPHGMMLLTGNGWTQRQVDVLMRMWQNLKRGISKSLALPVLAAPQNAKVEIVDFSKIKGDEALYQDMLNLMIGCFCAVYRFPVGRLGYRISGRGPDTKKKDALGQAALTDVDDIGLVALLGHWENVINQNFIWPRWPTLRFKFTGANPKEDAREYEFKKNASTWGEARAEADLPPLMEMVKDKELKPLAEIMSMAPIDPNLSGVFQSIAAAFLKGGEKDAEATQGNTMTSRTDPARAEAHGHMSGVRRNSAIESSDGKVGSASV